jgi:hypothetical protein
VAPRIAVAVVGITADLPEPPVEGRVVRAGLAIAEVLLRLGDHRLGRSEAAPRRRVGDIRLDAALLLDALLELPHALLILLAVLEDDRFLVGRPLAQLIGHSRLLPLVGRVAGSTTTPEKSSCVFPSNS